MIDPTRLASLMRLPTALDTNQIPFKFVVTTLFHSSSFKSREGFPFSLYKEKLRVRFVEAVATILHPHLAKLNIPLSDLFTQCNGRR